MGFPIDRETGRSIWFLNSLISRLIRNVWCKWLAIWNIRLVCPSKYTGTTVAFDLAIILAVNDLHLGSKGCEKGVWAVETVPPGKIPMAPPWLKNFTASLRVLTLSCIASFVEWKEIGKITSLRSSDLRKMWCAIIRKLPLVIARM